MTVTITASSLSEMREIFKSRPKDTADIPDTTINRIYEFEIDSNLAILTLNSFDWKPVEEFGGAVLIGEETGSRIEGFAAGSTETIYLPHSRIKIDIPRYHIINLLADADNITNRGLIPDHEIAYTIEDILADIDLEMNKALELIAKNSGNN